ncbi:hypothetical protein [Nostoc sp. MS1]|uniref:hypothetical protein n=1 Tax=Nostoc sp. MS1 TaxID=2764711 RepID=UPI001CC5D177|nr:hypothetical protein [Nostoc sp. MS1]BCL34254.1 hypothetical protein NSMS1_07010 [Nostoc sp. MS1]
MTDSIDVSPVLGRPRFNLVSTFELLVKPITPVTAPGFEAVARTIVQGYFLTIANTSSTDIRIRLQFAATTPELNLADTVTIKDVTGKDEFQELIPTSNPKKYIYDLSIPAHDTALVTLLPDVTKPEILKAKNLEIRGYVEIALVSSTASPIDLLLTPEHRGTFVPDSLKPPVPDFDQLAYALPTANGSSKFTLTGPAKLNKEFKNEVKEIKELEKAAENKLPETGPVESPTVPSELQRVLGMMAQRLDEIEQRTTGNGNGNGRSFIEAQERPNVGQRVVNHQ